MTRKFLVVVVLVSLMAGLAQARPRRTVYTRENRKPEVYQPEIGGTFFYQEIPEERVGVADSKDIYTTTPYARLGLAENFALYGSLPFIHISPEQGDSESGIGDMVAGFELVAWEDIFGYPYFLPYAEISLATGSESKGMGAGNSLVTLGMSIGTTTYDVLDWVIDAQYTIDRDEENIARFSGSLIWNVSDLFSILGEVRTTDKKVREDEDYPIYFLGGLTYEPNEDWFVNVYGGGASRADSDALVGVKVAYTF